MDTVRDEIEKSKAALLASIEQTGAALEAIARTAEEATPIPSQVIENFFDALEYAQKNCP